MHYAIHGHTAAEHILERADHQKQNMGLMTWQDLLILASFVVKCPLPVPIS